MSDTMTIKEKERSGVIQGGEPFVNSSCSCWLLPLLPAAAAMQRPRQDKGENGLFKGVSTVQNRAAAAAAGCCVPFDFGKVHSPSPEGRRGLLQRRTPDVMPAELLWRVHPLGPLRKQQPVAFTPSRLWQWSGVVAVLQGGDGQACMQGGGGGVGGVCGGGWGGGDAGLEE